MKGFTYTPAQKHVVQTLADYLYDSGKRSSNTFSQLIAEVSQKIGAVSPLSTEEFFKALMSSAKELSEITTNAMIPTLQQFGYTVVGALNGGSIERLATSQPISQN